MTSPADRELVRDYLRGDNSAFETLYGRYRESLFRFLVFTLGNEQLAEDIFQRAFMKFFEKAAEFRILGGGNFKSWIFTVAVNLSRDEYRRRENRLRARDFRLEDAADTRLPDPGSAADREKVTLLVRSAIEELPVRFRQIVGFRYYSDLTFEEIGKILRLPAGTVKSRLTTALKRLGSKLKDVHDVI